MSASLAARGIDHVVLERGEVANSWRTERWDSLRLLTPNWQSRLPGYSYDGNDPDGFRTTPETIRFLDRYAETISAPVQTHTRVTSLSQTEDGYQLKTTEGDWRCRSVVLASGACNIARVPAFADAVPANILTLTAMQYRNPRQLEDGGVLIVGASATGTQLAEEIHRAGHPVTLSVGEHIRAPRVYRGKDIQWWMDKAGVLNERYDEVDDINRARRVPSLQLTGTPDRSTLDLNTLVSHGVRLVGPLATIRDGKAQFSGSLMNQCALSDLKLGRLLDTIDQWATANGLDAEVPPAYRLEPTQVETSPALGLDLTSGEIRTIIWAAGFRPDYSWLDIPVLDRKGLIRHDGGVVASPGMYLMGMPFLRRRKSALIDGAGDDARDLSAHLAVYLSGARKH
jgi:putative flavoprotein involved in K+ transport